MQTGKVRAAYNALKKKYIHHSTIVFIRIFVIKYKIIILKLILEYIIKYSEKGLITVWKNQNCNLTKVCSQAQTRFHARTHTHTQARTLHVHLVLHTPDKAYSFNT